MSEPRQPVPDEQNPANNEAAERPGETPGERAQRLHEQQARTVTGTGDAGPAGLLPAGDDQAAAPPGGDGAPPA